MYLSGFDNFTETESGAGCGSRRELDRPGPRAEGDEWNRSATLVGWTDVSQPCLNPIGFRDRLSAFRGSPVELDLRPYHASLAAIGALAPELVRLSDSELRTRSLGLRQTLLGGSDPDSLTVEAFALGREAARRALGLRLYDEQVIAALALARGRVVEMATGEGKTLTAAIAATLVGWRGRGCGWMCW